MIFACAPNFRDLGGKHAANDGRVRPGMLYRCEAICAPPPDDAAALGALGIRLVCDLRSDREREVAATCWPDLAATVLAMDVVADFRAHADPMAAMRADPTASGAMALMIDTYRALPAACASHLAHLFDRLAEGELPVLVHCTAGKDRTGFVVAMLLHALGVPPDAIVADYMRSGECPNPTVVAATRRIMEAGLGRSVDEAALAELAGVRRDYIDASFQQILRDHGSTDAYLRGAAGLDDAKRRTLIAALVE